jgi:hypothetical protein
VLPEPFDTQIPPQYSLGVFLYALLPIPFVPLVYVAVSLVGVPSATLFGVMGGLRVLLAAGVPALLTAILGRYTAGWSVGFWAFVGACATCGPTATAVHLALRIG